MRKILTAIGFALALPVILILIWWLISLGTTSIFMPKPDQLLREFFETWVGDRFFTDVLPSLARFAIGTGVAIVFGILIGLLVGLSRNLRDYTEPIFEFFRAIPPPVLIPVFGLLIGVSDQMKVVVIAAGAIWPVLLNTIEGVRGVDSVQSETSRSYGIHGIARVRFQVMPAAAPSILAGVRQALPIGIILMVISEMFFSSSGLGFSIIQFQRRFAIPEMWSGILMLGLIGYAVSMIFKVVERRLLHWYYGLKDIENAA
ncbi:ABC-type nitrate/sulfonate/bicarbonate transport system permease component [Homoserinimonas aerilata]|uniref:ABC-type nitrate/sulfonate/bicarbonate transport system permease component n=1 Tax=Homoserinimonas aerilata TaxID=1162970 RepID=A0A542YHG9_9MICO|nr:ABC transporter permease [Homoserinimonas aerilata]TQL47528.1 ABC-type nitrate/sulfonate/bicarbonate transport system permease component [Homoserinimonas aerilata]